LRHSQKHHEDRTYQLSWQVHPCLVCYHSIPRCNEYVIGGSNAMLAEDANRTFAQDVYA
jgi:hypothetical protein